MSQTLDLFTRPLTLAVTASALCAALGAGGWWYWRRRAAGQVPARLRQLSDALLAGVVLPDADDGRIHIDYLLLTRQGLLVLDVRDVAGHVFGSEPMQEWTVLGRNRRFTFINPLPQLYDRMAAVRRLVPDVPVRGLVAFTSRAEFSKGFPPNVLMFATLCAELEAARTAPDAVRPEILQAGWQQLLQAAAPKPRT
jgi:hypothetical protein